MLLDVAFLPSLLLRPGRSVIVVVDVLRATSVLVTLCARGVRGITVVADQREALRLRDEALDQKPLVCGEAGGLPPTGFDYGNSPAEFSRLDLRGRDAVLFTSNGTKALVQVASAPVVLVGALLNRTAVVGAALKEARDTGLDVILVCSGTAFGTRFTLEDAFCAGALVSQAVRQAGPDVRLGDSARAALRLFDSYGGDAEAAFRESAHGGSTLVGLRLGEDLIFAAQTDVYDVVPRARVENGRVVVRSQSLPAGA